MVRGKSTYLILDGISWKHASLWQHLLMLHAAYCGVAISLVWIDLAKQGPSSYAKRIDLSTLALARFDLRWMMLLADREYIGEEWFRFLIDKGLHFCIRSYGGAHFARIDRTAPG